LAELLDPDSLVEQFLPDFTSPDFPCMRFVDPYGNTVFNQFQIRQAVSELERLLAQKHTPEVEQHLRAVLDFIRQAQSKVHTYIWFYGD